MLFNSLDFAVFLPVVFLLYWLGAGKSIFYQNSVIVASSFFFYGWWDWRFLFLMIFSASVDFISAIFIEKSNNKTAKKRWLGLSIFCNLGILAFFKYFNFFAGNFAAAFEFFGHPFQPFSLKIILPVGISFYTFQALSYTIDVYRGRLQATRNILDYFAFISFFPQLVAGPIERATHLLPQFFTSRRFYYAEAADGLKQMLWGLVKKIVIADNCARYVNEIFAPGNDYNGSTVLMGAVLFTIQIYSDFSGYSDIAIGAAKLFGIRLMTNFSYPFFSRDIAEFWRRWHISLTTWFRDYVYIPLGGSRGSIALQLRNVFIIFLVSGLWHGANWTFIAWGILNAIYFIPLLITKKNRKHLDIVAGNSILPSIKESLQIAGTFAITVFAFIFFRAENISHAFILTSKIFSVSLFQLPAILPFGLLLYIALFFMIEWIGRKQRFAIANIGMHWPRPLRLSFYYALIILIYLGGNFSSHIEFIYFQF